MDVVGSLIGGFFCLVLPFGLIIWWVYESHQAKEVERSRRARRQAEKRQLTRLANPNPKSLASRGEGAGTYADYKTTSSKGAYVSAKAPDHPLATKNGWLPLHRAVLFDHLGPGHHKCYWCSTTIEWHKPGGGPYAYPAIQVDHLDDNPRNNRASNLAATCQRCNLGRSKGRFGAQQQLWRIHANERKIKAAYHRARARRYR